MFCTVKIMDPKMDSGMLEAEYESFNALKPRLPEEVIGIMDQLLSYEASSNSINKNLYDWGLILGVDGVAQWKRSLADSFHLSVHR